MLIFYSLYMYNHSITIFSLGMLKHNLHFLDSKIKEISCKHANNYA